jgi:hypothetical protein
MFVTHDFADVELDGAAEAVVVAGFGSAGFVSAGFASTGFAGFAAGMELLLESVL